MSTLKQILNECDKFANFCGMRLTTVTEGYARAEMTVGGHHLNAAGVCQGGVYFTLADLAFAAVMNSHGPVTLGVQNCVTYMQSAREGDTLIAEAEEIKNHHRMPYGQVRITNQRGELLCVVTGTAYRKNERFSFNGLE